MTFARVFPASSIQCAHIRIYITHSHLYRHHLPAQPHLKSTSIELLIPQIPLVWNRIVFIVVVCVVFVSLASTDRVTFSFGCVCTFLVCKCAYVNVDHNLAAQFYIFTTDKQLPICNRQPHHASPGIPSMQHAWTIDRFHALTKTRIETSTNPFFSSPPWSFNSCMRVCVHVVFSADDLLRFFFLLSACVVQCATILL